MQGRAGRTASRTTRGVPQKREVVMRDEARHRLGESKELTALGPGFTASGYSVRGIPLGRMREPRGSAESEVFERGTRGMYSAAPPERGDGTGLPAGDAADERRRVESESLSRERRRVARGANTRAPGNIRRVSRRALGGCRRRASRPRSARSSRRGRGRRSTSRLSGPARLHRSAPTRSCIRQRH
jgi:hypothetical protein